MGAMARAACKASSTGVRAATRLEATRVRQVVDACYHAHGRCLMRATRRAVQLAGPCVGQSDAAETACAGTRQRYACGGVPPRWRDARRGRPMASARPGSDVDPRG